MLRESFLVIRQNYSYYTGFLVVLCGLPWIDGYLDGSTTGLNVATFFIWSLLALLVQGAVLYGQDFQELLRREDNPLRRSRGFLWKNFSIFIFTILITSTVFFTIYGVQRAENTNIVAALLIGAIFYVLTLALVGTWLPASIYGHNTSLIEAFRRGRKHIIPIIWRIMVAFLVAMAISFFVIIAFSMAATSLGGHQSVDSIADGSPNSPMVIGTLIATAAHIWSATYMSIVVTRFYMASEGITYFEGQRSELATGL